MIIFLIFGCSCEFLQWKICPSVLDFSAYLQPVKITPTLLPLPFQTNSADLVPAGLLLFWEIRPALPWDLQAIKVGVQLSGGLYLLHQNHLSGSDALLCTDVGGGTSWLIVGSQAAAQMLSAACMPSLGRAHFSSETFWKLDAPCADGMRRCVLIASDLDLVITEG